MSDYVCHLPPISSLIRDWNWDMMALVPVRKSL